MFPLERLTCSKKKQILIISLYIVSNQSLYKPVYLMSKILLPLGITNHFSHKSEKCPLISCCLFALEWCATEFSTQLKQQMKRIAFYTHKIKSHTTCWAVMWHVQFKDVVYMACYWYNPLWYPTCRLAAVVRFNLFNNLAYVVMVLLKWVEWA